MKPLDEHQITVKILGQWELGGVTVTQSQAGTIVTWSFDFTDGIARVDSMESYLIGYLDHNQTRKLMDLLTEQATLA